jgi:hypothetical protein
MSLTVRRWTMAAMVSLSLVPTVAGFGGRPRYAVTYYYPAPVVWPPGIPVVVSQPAPVVLAPSWPVCPPAIAPVPRGPVYARPMPAPPSQPPTMREPPLAPQLPPVAPMPPVQPPAPSAAVMESRPYFDLYPVDARGGEKPLADRCSVGFWNVTDRELGFKVDGQPRTLARGKSLTLELGRQFTWQIEGRDAQIQRVAPENVGLDIVIRH